MIHPAIVMDLLEGELVVAREAHGRRLHSLERIGTDIFCILTENDVDAGVVLRFDGARYDAEPLGLSVVDEHGNRLTQDRWPAGLVHGEHTTLKRPFACIRGCAEYHQFPGHTGDPWDHHRSTLRFTNLLAHVLKKVNR